MTSDPVCLRCRNLTPFERGTPPRCRAFPDRIPPVMLLGQSGHRGPLPGDHGVRFEPVGPAARGRLLVGGR